MQFPHGTCRRTILGKKASDWSAILILGMTPEDEDYFLNPPPGSAAARAVEFGIDLTLTLENLRLTPEERIRKLDQFIIGIARLKDSARRLGPRDAGNNQDN